MRIIRRASGPRRLALIGTLPFLALACVTDPRDGVVFQVIEEVAFADTLGIDLSLMEIMPNGVYRQDLIEGTGEELADSGQVAFVDHTGYLTDGTVFSGGDRFSDVRKFQFQVEGFDVLFAFEVGLLGMLEGGTRRLILPPEQAYGSSSPSALVPGGSILLFDVTLDSIQ